MVTVTCAASGTATYDCSWVGQGMNAQTALKRAIEGKSKLKALNSCNNFCNNFAGIDHNVPCQIQLVGGNVSIIPSNPNQIQMLPS